MKQVIYIDILFLLNFFITYLLVLTTKVLLKTNAKQYRLIIGALIGGASAMIIFAPEMNFFLSSLYKLLCAGVIVGVSYKFASIKNYLRGVAFFFCSSFLFCGIVIAVWFTFKPGGMVVNNSTVYFDIGVLTLALSSLLAYIISVLIIKIHNRVTAKNQIYSLTVINKEKSKTVNAFFDTGNKLKEPFSGSPVIVLDSDEFVNFFDEEKVRIIPYETVGGSGMLDGYLADKVIIKSLNNNVEINNQYIALSKEKINNGEFKAILSGEILNV